MRVSRSLMVLAFMACTGIAEADGSIGFEEVDAVLRQRPELRTYLVDTLCISNSGLASRVAGEYPMGGSRLGPYELDAKPKGQAGPYVFRLIVNTSQTFFDKNGKEADVTEAVRVKEILSSIELSELPIEDRMSFPSFNCKK